MDCLYTKPINAPFIYIYILFRIKCDSQQRVRYGKYNNAIKHIDVEFHPTYEKRKFLKRIYSTHILFLFFCPYSRIIITTINEWKKLCYGLVIQFNIIRYLSTNAFKKVLVLMAYVCTFLDWTGDSLFKVLDWYKRWWYCYCRL